MIFTRKPLPETDFYQYFIFRHSKSIDPTLPFTRIFELFVKTLYAGGKFLFCA